MSAFVFRREFQVQDDCSPCSMDAQPNGQCSESPSGLPERIPVHLSLETIKKKITNFATRQYRGERDTLDEPVR